MNKIIGFYRKCDLLTMIGTMLSFIGMILAFNEHYSLAVFCMILSGIYDAFDGVLARKGNYSKTEQIYGGQLDSLSDVICFGAFPAIITSLISNNIITIIICIFYMLCGVIRLAYFNMLSITDDSKKNVFIGVPITTVSIVYPLAFFVIRFINYEWLSSVMPLLLFLLGISFILRINIPKIDVIKTFNRVINKYSINFLIFPLFLIISSDIFYKLLSYDLLESLKLTMLSIPHNTLVILLFIIIIDMLFMILFCLTKSSRNTKIVITVIALLLLVINDIKCNIMGIPLMVSDINYLNPANMTMMGIARGSVGNWIILTIIKSIAIIICSIIFVLLEKDKLIKIYNVKMRLFLTIFFVINLLLLFAINNNDKKFLTEKVYNITINELMNYSSVNELYDKHGFFPGIYLNTLSDNNYPPTNYNAQEVKDLLKNVEKKDSKTWGKANVVFILSEAFSDLENIHEIKFSESLMPNINSYKESNDKIVMDLLVPTYGGTSVNTEFEILTGVSLSFWKTGFIPYNQYYNSISGKKAPNIIKEFNNNGYETIYLTPWSESSYKSKYVYTSIGIDKTVYNLLGEYKRKQYISDKSLMDAIYDELLETKEGNYKFIMSASAQNHFPYDGQLYENYDVNVEETSFDEEDTQILKNYAQGIYDADKELNNLYKKIQELDVPTIIVFFGDHLPYTLNSKGGNPYTDSNYFNTSDNRLNKLRKYTTKAVILSNYDIDTEKLGYINASYLGAYILNKMDLKISNYFKYIDNARKIVPVFNRECTYKDNIIYNINNSDQVTLNEINNYKNIQYGSFYEFIG